LFAVCFSFCLVSWCSFLFCWFFPFTGSVPTFSGL
jgi:hypothetical protein